MLPTVFHPLIQQLIPVLWVLYEDLGQQTGQLCPTFRLRANRNCKNIVELIRAYDTWDWQNDPNMSNEERKAADELNQLFWFYPLSQSNHL